MTTEVGGGTAVEPRLAAAVDLRAPTSDPWDAITVPAGWEDIAALASSVAADLDELVDDIVERIVDEVPDYGVAVPSDDLHASVLRTIDMMLVGIAENRSPRAEEISIRRELGHRRALQGLPVRQLIQAYHVGYRELWQALVRRLPPDSPATATSLLTAATTVWGWVHETTDAIAEAHRETIRSQEAHVIGARQRFTELLVTGDLAADEGQRLGASIGFDVDGPFLVIAAAVEAVDGTEPRRLQAALEELPGIHAVAARGPKVILTTQRMDEDELIRLLPATLPEATFGVGMERPGLAGARESLGDAERALEVAAPGTVARFEDEWLSATLVRSGPRLSEVLATGVETAAQHPHLAETVLVFADAGFSVSETARQLSLHANTVSYRLDRWHALTGWDPRTFAGLSRSVAALRLAPEG
ncbi:MAG: helix-turn-helix domain-containing protein [Actinobacteria bacterium]|nr:helix-turn-helix domain-containing protein [Actinomycetota bacterium]